MGNRDSVVRLVQRVYDIAEQLSGELSPRHDSEWATVVHGDFKAMNVFLPTDENSAAIMIDFSAAGVGISMSDVSMHIVHANLPEALDNGGEETLVEGYVTALEGIMSAKHGSKWAYPRDMVMRHYQLACVDYLRFIMGRFWKSATPETFEKKKSSKNTTLINRNLHAALRFISKCDGYLAKFEKEKTK